MSSAITEDDTVYKELASVVGDITLTWANAENALDMAAALILKKFGPIAHEAELPRMLKRKVRFIKTALRSEPRLDAVKSAGACLAAKFMVLKSLRHDLTHGITRQVSERIWVIANFDIVGSDRIQKTVEITVEDAEAFLHKVRELQDDAMIFAALVSRIEP